jgi:hypothetical protein
MGLTAVMDMPFLHVTNKRSKIEAAAVSSKLIRRLQDYMIDRGLEGKWLLVHCSPEAVDLWKEFFERMNAVPAERYLIRVKPGIEV